MQPASHPLRIPRSMQFALFLTGLLWMLTARFAADHAALGLGSRFQFSAIESLLTEAFFVFLLLVGFTMLHWIATREGGMRIINSLPMRPTWQTEWLGGAALGWGMALAAVLPAILTGNIYPDFWLQPRAWGLALLSIVTTALAALGIELAFRGYLFKRLILSIGEVAATIVMALLFAIACALRPNSTALSFIVALLAGILFAVAYLRTHALWVGWGIQFAWIATSGIVFGLPVRGTNDAATLVQSTITGRAWLTGGQYGPEGALITVLIMLGALPVLYRLTRDYAWAYTHAPIIPGAYAVVMQPPAAHTAMERAAAAAPAPLVQIASLTPTQPSTSPEIEQHLRNNASQPQD